MIYYRDGHAEAAKDLQKALAPNPIKIEPAPVDLQRADLTLRVGNDLLAFDQQLFAASAKQTSRRNRPKKPK